MLSISKILKHFFVIILLSLPILCFAAKTNDISTVDNQHSSVVYSASDSLIFIKVMDKLKNGEDRNLSGRLIDAANLLLGTPYLAHTLEQSPERLIINLRETDCILFVETCLALSMCSLYEESNFENFLEAVRTLRYRDGLIDGYCSRIHYTSEWFTQLENLGLGREISKDVANTVVNQKFSFMSEHTSSYVQLSNNIENVEKIKQIERNLNRAMYYIIPKDGLKHYLGSLRTGDILGFSTSIKGLDITHVAIIYVKENGELSFIHASMKENRVVIERKSLLEYVNSISSCNGIRVFRLK